MKIGIIGSGQIGGTLTRRLSALGHKVFVANSRGPESLKDLAAETGAKRSRSARLPEAASSSSSRIPRRIFQASRPISSRACQRMSWWWIPATTIPASAMAASMGSRTA